MIAQREFEVGIALPTVGASVRDVAAAARLAEGLGVASVWAGDHLAFRLPVLDPVVALSVAAGATTRVRLGFGVLQAGLRHPLLIAKAVSSLAAMADGRVIAGFGAGGDYAPEWRALGLDPSERGSRLDELLSVFPGLVGRSAVSHAGRHWTFDAPPLTPSPTCSVPVWVGGRTTAALQRAARHDGWLGLFLRPDAFGAAVHEVVRIAAAEGGAAPRCGIAVIACAQGSDSAARERCANYLKDAYDLPMTVARRWAVGGASHLRDVVMSYRAAGADHLLVHLVDDSTEAWSDVIDAVSATCG